MKITTENVKRYAAAIGISLDRTECETMSADLNRQFDGFSVLDGVNTDGVEPLFGYFVERAEA